MIDGEYVDIAANASDASNTSGTVTILAGQLTVDIVMPTIDDSITEWNEILRIDIQASSPPAGYWIDTTTVRHETVGILDNEWRWEKRRRGTIASEVGTTVVGPGYLSPTTIDGSLAVRVSGNESDLMQGPNTFEETVMGQWSYSMLAPVTLQTTTTITRPFNLDPVTGFITQTTVNVGQDQNSTGTWTYVLKVGIADSVMPLSATATRNVVQVQVGGVVGLNGNISFGGGGVYFSSPTYAVNLSTFIVKLGAVKGASNPL